MNASETKGGRSLSTMAATVTGAGADWVWPRGCRSCGAEFDDDHPPHGEVANLLCGACAATVIPGTDVCCPICGLVWADAPPDNGVAECGPCLQRPPRFARARAAFGYGGAVQDLIQRWKNGGDGSLGPGLSHALTDSLRAMGCDRWPANMLVVPLPSPWRRVWSRGYNPAGVLASRVATHTGLELRLGLRLRRVIPKARGMSRRDRQRRVAGAFAGRRCVRGRPVLLVDDVMTTGATADAAALALRRAGARYVEVAALARVVW